MLGISNRIVTRIRYVFVLVLQVGPDRTRWSGSTELMRVIGEARIKYLSHFFRTDQLCLR